MTGVVRVVALAASQTHDLRRRVLYPHLADPEVSYPHDELALAFHLGALDGAGRLVAVATYAPEPVPLAAAAVIGSREPAYRVRGMAVEPEAQGAGAATLVWLAGVDELRGRGAGMLWANARDSALGFYVRRGMTVVGGGFLAAGGLPHHLVVMSL